MATFFMFGKYSGDATNSISAARTAEAADFLKKHGGEIKAMYTLLGDHDLVLIVELPGIPEAMKASIDLGRMTAINFTTAPALSVQEFDTLMGR